VLPLQVIPILCFESAAASAEMAASWLLLQMLLL
jgi:hypothetical protein